MIQIALQAVPFSVLDGSWALPIVRLLCVLGDPDPKGPIFFLHFNEIDKYILRTKS